MTIQINYTTSLALCPLAFSEPDDQRRNPDLAENAKPKLIKGALIYLALLSLWTHIHM